MKTKKIIAMVLALSSASVCQALTVNVVSRSGFSATQATKLDKTIVILNHVLNSQEFKDRVLNFTYSGKAQFVQNNGLSNQAIYEMLMAGAEKYPKQTGANQAADMSLSIYFPPWYKRFSSAVAYTSTSDAYLHIYNSYYNSASTADLADTLVHEWTHKMGFDHDYNATAQRPYSVPYGIGGIIYDLVTAASK